MAKCKRINCKCKFVERVSKYGAYWSCSVCGRKIDKRCSCGGQRGLTTYNGTTASKCPKCGKPRY